jgi:hypothetical protein
MESVLPEKRIFIDFLKKIFPGASRNRVISDKTTLLLRPDRRQQIAYKPTVDPTLCFESVASFRHGRVSGSAVRIFWALPAVYDSESLQSLSHSGQTSFILASYCFMHSAHSNSALGISPYRSFISSAERTLTLLHPHCGQADSIR